MVKRAVWLVVMLCLVGGVPLAQGDVTTQRYRELRAAGQLHDDQFITYLTGVGRGFSWANAQLVAMRRPRLYCAPENLRLTHETMLDILNAELAGPHRESYGVIELALLHGLQRTFPCPAQPRGNSTP
jgi:hypothetical protein